MRTRFRLALPVLAAGILLAAEAKKVVIANPGPYYSPLGPSEIAELRAAAPGINLVPFDKDRLMSELADADGVIGHITPEMLRAAKKLKWVQVGSAGVEPYIAGRSDGETARYLALYKENLRRFAAGEPLLNVVDKEKGY
jgi:phosphoglycerate dehydrogenase-like enzyme